MTLASIAHESAALFAELGTAGGFTRQLGCFTAHPAQQTIGEIGVETIEPHIERADKFERGRSLKEADGRSHARIGRDDDALDAELFSEARGVQWCCAAEGDERTRRHFGAALDSMHARGVGHVLVDDFGDAVGCGLCRHAKRFADVVFKSSLGLGRVDGDLATSEARRIDLAQSNVGVGDGRLRAAATVTRRTRLGASAFRTDHDALHGVDARKRAATGADLDHLDDRDAEREAAALHEPGRAINFKCARLERLAVVDQADFGSRAAHIERQDRVFAAFCRRTGSQDRAAGRSGFDQPHGEGAGGLEAGEAAARCHQVDRRGTAFLLEGLLEPLQITGHQRLHVGIRNCGGRAFVLARFRAHFR